MVEREREQEEQRDGGLWASPPPRRDSSAVRVSCSPPAEAQLMAM